MKHLSRKLGLRRETEIELQISEQEFFHKLKSISNINRFDLFADKNFKLCSTINPPNFKVRHRLNLLEPSLINPVILGNVKSDNQKTQITIISKGDDNFVIILFIIIIITLLIFIGIQFNLNIEQGLQKYALISLGLLGVLIPVLLLEFFRRRNGIIKLTNILLYNFQEMENQSFRQTEDSANNCASS